MIARVALALWPALASAAGAGPLATVAVGGESGVWRMPKVARLAAEARALPAANGYDAASTCSEWNVAAEPPYPGGDLNGSWPGARVLIAAQRERRFAEAQGGGPDAQITLRVRPHSLHLPVFEAVP